MRQFWRNLRSLQRNGVAVVTAAVLAWHGLGIQPIAGAAASTSTTFASDFVTYIADKTLMLAEKELRMEQLADKATLPRRNSTTFQYTRYERVPLPQSTLTEGVTPTENQMSITTVTATVQQWGQVVILTDVAELVVKHPVVQKGIKLLALGAAETIDRVIQLILLGGTNIQYANSRTSRATVVATDVLTTTEVTKAVANLRNNGARVYGGNSLGGDDDDRGGNGKGDGNLYFGVLDPSVEADISGDTTWVNAQSYSSIANLRNFEIGRWKGVRWLLSNFLYTFTGVAAAATGTATTGGSIPTGINVYVVVTGVNNNTGFEERLYQQATQATAGGTATNVVTVTIPSTTGYTYNVYAGLTSGTTYQVSGATGLAPSATYTITAVPTSGTTNPAIPGTGVTVHTVYVVGEEAFTVVKLDGMSLQTFVTPKGESDSDPLSQRRKIGWKIMFNAVICNQNFLRRLECGSAF